MPLYEFDLESFSTVTIAAPGEAAARDILDTVLNAVSHTEYVIGAARVIRSGSKSKSGAGRPPDARRLVDRMIALQASGLSQSEIAAELRVHRTSVWRALKWARDGGASG